MADRAIESHGAQPAPQQSDRGHPLPRRTTPEKSITLRHHRIARDASIRAASGKAADPASSTSPPRRGSSGESHGTRQSDAKKWFDRSNANTNATFDPSSMDVDPPFFQKESDSSNEESHGPPRASMLPYPPHSELQATAFRPTVTHSSSADDFRSVIDDLTVENKRLKDELKRYKQFGSDMLRKEKLFEIKVHGLPARKKRELEAQLRDFAASLGEESTETSPKRKTPKHIHRLHGSSLSNSKHASSSSSRSRPVDSAYASGSTGNGTGTGSGTVNSSSTSLDRPSAGRAKSSEQKVQSYLENIPEGLYPRHMMMTDKDKKRWIVQRLEQLFTGKIKPELSDWKLSGVTASPLRGAPGKLLVPPNLPGHEASREAVMQPHDSNNKKSRTGDDLSTSNSNAERTDAGDLGNTSGSGSGSGGRSGNNVTPPSADVPEQRATRPLDLDPDRNQTASENMDYIRHLGVLAPEYLSDGKFAPRDVGMDADGWVYLNLLSNMAQLHIMNVTQDFIRSAVSEKSTKFQLSPDKRKIRWRGGTDGTKFSGDSSGSGDNSHKSPSNDTDGSNEDGARKRQKAAVPTGKTHANLSRGTTTGSSESIHYKPLFIHRVSSADTSGEETGSPASFGAAEESNRGADSRWNMSGSGSSRKKRRNDGAIIYYSGAPFCTDLSGDPGDISPTTYMTSSGQALESEVTDTSKSPLPRTLSGSSLVFRPLVDGPSALSRSMDVDMDQEPGLTTDDTDTSDDLEAEFPWCGDADLVQVKDVAPCLEPCGIGGVVPEDHLVVVCMTRRPRHATSPKAMQPHLLRQSSGESADSIASRLAAMTASPTVHVAPSRKKEQPLEIEYLSGRWKRLRPIPLPPPTTFFPPFSSSSDDSDDGRPLDSEALDSDDDEKMVETFEAIEAVSQQANPHQSENTYPENDLTSNDEEDEISPHLELNEFRPPPSRGSRSRRHGKRSRASLSTSHRGKSSKRASLRHTGSSLATAGEGHESGYSSSQEEVEDD